ncbi:transcriptional regulator [Agrobacterium tumefaciens]|uniref:transcriptional regulator n=1 Tax=Agrobacterium tumefaciens TaxID=358 RepID=UPI0015730A98|nr:transcriptional regulator [Agrobacterium tumefaciens]
MKSVARQANEAFSPGEHGDVSRIDEPVGQDRSVEPILTSATPQQNNRSATEEIHMPDEIEAVTQTSTPEPVVVPAAPVKQRKPRAKKAGGDADRLKGAAASGVTDAADGRPRRGRKARTIPPARAAKDKPLNRGSSISDVLSTAPVNAIDDMAELLRLEDENRSLRKQLSEKLRAENADLRKRLNLD